MTLNEIGLKTGTDKSTVTHHYLDNYEKYFEELRYVRLVILEIGVGNGSSIKMWRQYFENSKVYGIDNNPDCAGDGIFIGSQDDEQFLDKVLVEIGKPDIIIDDCSHYSPLTIKSFEYLFPKMADDGWYVVEDTACFYDKTYGLAPDFDKGMSDVFNFFSGLASHVDIQGRGMTGNVEYALRVQNENFAPVPKYSPILESMHIHPSLWFFKKR